MQLLIDPLTFIWADRMDAYAGGICLSISAWSKSDIKISEAPIFLTVLGVPSANVRLGGVQEGKARRRDRVVIRDYRSQDKAEKKDIYQGPFTSTGNILVDPFTAEWADLLYAIGARAVTKTAKDASSANV